MHDPEEKSIPVNRFASPLPRLVALCIVLGWTSSARAAITAWLDYTNFDVRLNELATNATVTPYTESEQTQMRAGILSDLRTIYGDFDVTFTEDRPESGDYERLVWGNTTATPGLLGLADQIDFRNLNRNNTARIYPVTFSGIVDEFDGSDQRALQLSQLTHAFAGTAAHELGHNLGLEHCDAYGAFGITPENYANTGGLQNNQIMATGGTGLTEVGRETVRSFSDWEKVKLAYADGALDNAPPVLAEQAMPHDTVATAQNLSLSNLTAFHSETALVTGLIDGVNETDYFSFLAQAGQTITARVLSETLGRFTNPLDSFLSLLGPSGELLFADDNIEYSRNVFNSGLASDRYSLDTFFVNIPITQTGTYTLAVRGSNGDTGSYELLIAAQNLSSSVATVVPEASTMQLIGSCLLLGIAITPRRCHVKK